MTAPISPSPASPVTPVGPISSGGGGFCGRCGTPFGAGSGQFCAHCGNRVKSQPAVATGYSYPVVPASSVPAAQHKLSHLGMVLIAFGSLFVLVVIITAVAVGNTPTSSSCHFTCGPDVGSRLLSHTAYQNSQYGFRVEYEAPLTITNPSSNSVEFTSNLGWLFVYASSGTNTSAGIQNAINNLSNNTFQDQQQTSSQVPGAEVGLVPGVGVVYKTNFVTAGYNPQPMVMMCLAATQGNLTLTVLAIAPYDNSVDNAPFDMANGTAFDYEVSNTIWPGGT